ncbi:metallophosphoesterase family protein [Lichenifustis flavocetrariae]|uniref:Metallophosphoesterase n=1 Tax=Lichenifustis flavocetrariae TaxID=2949735 RepID=A0AA42CR62_9HYPH|nr:metallophosphoesterase [Lichenifustis flavocetrariae]MCW6512152.1 metallophosphoesterase [Lichenifustis flavocetrariae]
MRTIAHLSDLHFGRVDPAIPPALLRAVSAAMPHLVVMSGDFTQRARVREFEEAARFVEALPVPVLSVPGNHDVPLYDVMRRWLSPLGRYRRYIASDLAPFYGDAEIAVLGVNTARSLTFKSGRINRRQIGAAVARLALCGPDVMRIVVTHHPFDATDGDPADEARLAVLGRADMAMAGLLRVGVDIILSGHLHASGIGQTTMRYPLPAHAALLIQAGTATSTRRRGEENSFNVVRIAEREVAIERMVWRPDRGDFTSAGTDRFLKAEVDWVHFGPPAGPAPEGGRDLGSGATPLVTAPTAANTKTP